MIVEAIISLKERKGSSRQAIKKYIQSNHSLSNFDNHFNNALKKGVQAGIFSQPKGPVGPVKVVKEKLETPKKEKSKTTKKAPKKAVGTKSSINSTSTDKKLTNSKKSSTPKKVTKTSKVTPKKVTKSTTKVTPKKVTKAVTKKSTPIKKTTKKAGRPSKK